MLLNGLQSAITIVIHHSAYLEIAFCCIPSTAQAKCQYNSRYCLIAILHMEHPQHQNVCTSLGSLVYCVNMPKSKGAKNQKFVVAFGTRTRLRLPSEQRICILDV